MDNEYYAHIREGSPRYRPEDERTPDDSDDGGGQ